MIDKLEAAKEVLRDILYQYTNRTTGVFSFDDPAVVRIFEYGQEEYKAGFRAGRASMPDERSQPKADEP